MRIRIFNKFDPELKALWLDLEARAKPYIFQRYNWLYHWKKTIGNESPRTELKVVLMEDSNGPQALLPFGLKQRQGVKILCFLGGNENDYHCPIYTQKGKLILQQPGLLEETYSKLPEFDILHIDKIPDEIANNTLFHKDNMYLSNYSYSAELPSSWEEYKKRLTSKIKADSRRQYKRLAEKGELRFESIVKGNKNIGKVLESFFEQKSKRYQATGAYDVLANKTVQSFYSEMPTELGKGVKTQLSALFLDNFVLATHWGVFDQTSFYLLMPTFAPDWNRYSPGRLLIEHLIQWSIRQRLKVFDFTVGGEDYKKEWCNREVKLFEIIKARTFKGKIYFKALMAKRALKQSPKIVKGVKKARKWISGLDNGPPIT
jgi:CelD/BcsL family acetyltransferase involved in cellulose biosynthesis